MEQNNQQKERPPTRDRARIQIPSNPVYVSWARKSVYDLALLYGFSRSAALDLKIITGEALVNIIKHAYENDTSKSIFLEIYMYRDYIEFNFQDFGKQIPVTKSQIRDLSDYREKGLGVFLISKLSDYHFFDQSAKTGTTLVVKKRLTV